ncbi:CASP-like protein [Drosera capensis]
MRAFAGTPGTLSALLLRVSQCTFAACSLVCMVTTPRFSNVTAFCYLIASMGVLSIWSLGLACLDAYAMTRTKDFRSPAFVSILVVGDWLTGMLSLSAASASAGVAVLLFHDLDDQGLTPGYYKYQLSVSLAFLSWISIHASSLIMLWLLAAF